MYSIYALLNKERGKIYIGQTENLNERLDLYKDKLFKNSYTAKLDGDWKLIYSEEVLTRKEALKREKQLKSCQGRKFIKNLIKFRAPQ